MSTTKNITLVDDDNVFVFLTTRAIEKNERLKLTNVFENGLDALNFLKENKDNTEELPEIILLDLSMPIMDGWQFLEQYTLLNPPVKKDISIYICTSSISPDDVERAKTINAVTDYIIKPVSKDKLVEVLASV